MLLSRLLLFILLCTTSCCVKGSPQLPCPSECSLVILVDARQLDYSCNRAFFQTMVKHPSDGSKNSDVGHAWVYLCGEGKEIEGGHSGERGTRCPKYFEGVMDLYEAGDPNPISYLWYPLNDGFFQQGSGGHRPTFAIKVDLSQEQFCKILSFIEHYDYEAYSLTTQQCCSFVEQVAALAGLSLDARQTMAIEPSMKVCGEELLLWSDPYYAQITFSCPEVLEESMVYAVEEGRAECALAWYLKERWKGRKFAEFCEDVVRLPSRWKRARMFR